MVSERISRLRRSGAVAAAITAIGAVFLGSAAQASPPSIIGYISNFDVSNGTDRPCHGFEIEVEDVTDTDIVYTYGNWNYGSAAAITNATFASGHSGVSIRYLATYNGSSWSRSTAVGSVEHFGVHIGRSPGVQRYTWLCEDASSPDSLIEYGGTTEGNHYPMPIVPAPTATVEPTMNGEVVRQEVANGEPPEPGEMMPDAVWVHRYAGSSAQDVTLDQLMSDDPVVQATIRSSILDGQFELVDGGASLLDDDPVSADDEASLLVIDSYEYTGPYDDSHTPACDGGGGANDCSNFVGTTRLSRMMFAADVSRSGPRSPFDVTIYSGGAVSQTGGSVEGDAAGSPNPGAIDCGPTCFAVVDTGTAVALTAVASPGYEFLKWGGACSGTTTDCNLTVNAIKHAKAYFVRLKTLKVVVRHHGSVTSTPPGLDCSTGQVGTCSAQYPKGSSVTLAATPEPGSSFVKWRGACLGQAGPDCTLSMSANKSATAVFS